MKEAIISKLSNWVQDNVEELQDMEDAEMAGDLLLDQHAQKFLSSEDLNYLIGNFSECSEAAVKMLKEYYF